MRKRVISYLKSPWSEPIEIRWDEMDDQVVSAKRSPAHRVIFSPMVHDAFKTHGEHKLIVSSLAIKLGGTLP